jgi:hypothetical protein
MDDGNCKSSFAPPRRYSECCHETGKQIGERQFQRWVINFWPEKNSNDLFLVFRPSGVPAIFRESDFYLDSLIFSPKLIGPNNFSTSLWHVFEWSQNHHFLMVSQLAFQLNSFSLKSIQT